MSSQHGWVAIHCAGLSGAIFALVEAGNVSSLIGLLGAVGACLIGAGSCAQGIAAILRQWHSKPVAVCLNADRCPNRRAPEEDKD